ncbi:MAG TPA: hypothetical protein VIM69_10585 [Opitutaceae bacterium]
MTLVIERHFAKRNEGTISNVKLEVNVQSVHLDGKELPDSSVEYLLTFALQSLQDAYAGAKTLPEAKAMFAKKYDKLIEGKIGVREAGESVSDEIRIGRKLMRAAIRANAEQWKKFTALPEDEQTAKLDQMVAKNAEKLAKPIAEEMKRLADEKAKKALLGKELSFEL